jgi:hypothetical protein
MQWCSSYLHRGYIELRSLLFTLDVLITSLAHQVTCLHVVHSRWHRYAKILSRLVHLCLFVVLNISSHGRNRCSLIKLPHDFLAPCNSCFLVMLKKKLTVGSFLTSWWAVQIVILPWIVSVHPDTSPARIARWKTSFPSELAWESDYNMRSNGWYITRGMQSKGKMSYLESRCYD